MTAFAYDPMGTDRYLLGGDPANPLSMQNLFDTWPDEQGLEYEQVQGLCQLETKTMQRALDEAYRKVARQWEALHDSILEGATRRLLELVGVEDGEERWLVRLLDGGGLELVAEVRWFAMESTALEWVSEHVGWTLGQIIALGEATGLSVEVPVRDMDLVIGDGTVERYVKVDGWWKPAEWVNEEVG